MSLKSNIKIVTRQLKIEDREQINSMLKKVYPLIGGYTEDMIRGALNNFAEGQFVVECNGSVAGFCMTFIIDEEYAITAHTWNEITGSGMASRHNPKGTWLYGMEICVSPEFRGIKIGQRLYHQRKKLCQRLGLKGIIFGGRVPGYTKKLKKYPEIQEYFDAVASLQTKDPTISFQIKNGFKPLMVLPNYMPSDHESLGFAFLMSWENPLFDNYTKNISYKIDVSENVRICTINFQQRTITSFDDFANIVYYFVEVASEYHCDFICFPEFVTMQLLSILNQELPPIQAMEKLDEWTKPYVQLFSTAAVEYNVNIIAGTHITRTEPENLQNVCYVFLRDGSIHTQAKIHPTPSERVWWNVKGGNSLPVINTDKGPIGILICYDVEFPELARYLIDQGAKILFVPFATDTKQGYLRVRQCAMARAIENQCYVVMSGNVGNLPRVHNMDINYAQSCILTPSDFPFARDGVAADTDANLEMVAIADLSLSDLTKFRNEGTVLNLKDRRLDLYSYNWNFSKT